MITPIEIRQHTFKKKTLGGYDIEDVQQFIAALAVDWEKMIEENRRLQSELQKVQAGYDSLKEVETMLQRTLHQAEQSTKDTLDNARRRASLIINEAEAKSREIVREGVTQRQQIDREIEDLCNRRDEILSQLHLFLKAQTERLVGFEKKGPTAVSPYNNPSEETAPPSPDNMLSPGLNGNGKDDTIEDIVNQL